LSFADFMTLALYHPELGYYRREHTRVGRAPGTDFYTATSSGPLFGELLCAAAVKLLRERNAEPHDCALVEIGAETEAGVLTDVAHPFGVASTLRVGAPLALAGEARPLVVFSNELFDAQPCRRFLARGGAWRELGVALRGEALTEIELSAAESSPPPELPAHAPEGYHLDLPLAARALAAALAAQSWRGLFIACDYGKSWRELTETTPQGTARAYFRHSQSNDLLARPGEQDLTCHVCWDWLAAALTENGFAAPVLESQEAFFIRHAGDFIARVTTDEAARLSPRKLALLQLLHPGYMGQKFQVLHAWRE
jgi:SAM-dependent MidA family methyltransferase